MNLDKNAWHDWHEFNYDYSIKKTRGEDPPLDQTPPQPPEFFFTDPPPSIREIDQTPPPMVSLSGWTP